MKVCLLASGSLAVWKTGKGGPAYILAAFAVAGKGQVPAAGSDCLHGSCTQDSENPGCSAVLLRAGHTSTGCGPDMLSGGPLLQQILSILM